MVDPRLLFQADLEEAQAQEIARLQCSLQEMQEKLAEANAAIVLEKEAARKAIEEAPPVIKEVPVTDNTMLESLTNRNNKLEVRVLGDLSPVFFYLLVEIIGL